MEAYDKNLVKKPMVLVLNKTDLNDGKEVLLLFLTFENVILESFPSC